MKQKKIKTRAEKIDETQWQLDLLRLVQEKSETLGPLALAQTLTGESAVSNWIKRTEQTLDGLRRAQAAATQELRRDVGTMEKVVSYLEATAKYADEWDGLETEAKNLLAKKKKLLEKKTSSLADIIKETIEK